MTNNDESKLAVLIDGDNIPSTHVKEMMEEIAKYGSPTIKRIYGDWTKPHLSKWKNVLLENAITPVQQYGYTVGKNATDSAMIIDAMDILYSGKVDGFCMVSSDSDFTRLATRLREAGMKVLWNWRKENSRSIYCGLRQVYLHRNFEERNPAKDAESSKEPKAKKESFEKITPRVIDLNFNDHF